MKYVYIFVIGALAIALRLWIRSTRRRRRSSDDSAQGTETAGPPRKPGIRTGLSATFARSWHALEDSLGDVGMIALREIRERVRGRIFRIGTLVILVAVGIAIIVPSLESGRGPTRQTVGVVGSLSAEAKQLIYMVGSRNHDSVKLKAEPSLAAAKAGLHSGRIDFAIIDGDALLLNQPASSSSSPADSALVQDIAEYLGVLKAYQAARLTPTQAGQLDHATSVPVHTLEPSPKSTTRLTSVFGLVLLFFMLTQYDTWILIGVMQEKSSRVVEVLLAMVRPIQLLGGKVLGIGLVALGQATLVVGFALIVAAAVGSDLLRGTAPLVLICQLIWLILGYGFYCWLYAAAGSTAERQDQVQTLALPLSIPILLGYIFAITVVSSGNADLFFKVLAYLPPTAPFCMPVLVGLGEVSWWEFMVSVLITLAGTVGMAIFAARIYRRAVLRTGGRVRLRELLGARVSKTSRA